MLVLPLRPHAGETISLQLHLHLNVVRVRPAAGAALSLCRLGQNAEEILHVMANLMRDHIGL